MTSVTQWSAEASDTPGRAERLARAQQALLGASAADALSAALDFHADPTSFLLVIQKTR